MNSSIRRLATTGFAALAVIAAACGSPDTGVEAGRSDRTQADADASTSTDDTTPEATDPPTTTVAPPATEPPATEPADTQPPSTDPVVTDAPSTDPPATDAPDATERPPAPAADGPSSVSADDLTTVFLPTNPDLLGPSLDLTDGRDPQTFLDEYLTFTGMDPVMEIAGAPLTLAWLILGDPVFDDDGNLVSASRFRARHRMAVEYTEVDGVLAAEQAEALRDELRPFIEAAYPGEVVTDTFNDEVIGLQAYGLSVGPEDEPTMFLDVQQHYFIVPRPVNEPLLAINVSRVVTGDDIVLSEVPNRDVFVNDAFQVQLDLFEEISTPDGTPIPTRLAVLRSIPSAGSANTSPSVRYDFVLPTDDFEAYVDDFAAVVEANDYDADENFGNIRSFDHEADTDNSSFELERDGDDVSLIIVGDRTAYPN